MAEAKIVLNDGTKVTIDGSPDEVARILSIYNTGSASAPSMQNTSIPRGKPSRGSQAEAKKDDDNAELDIAAIINKIKDCDEAEVIEDSVLDKSDVVNRVLMCLYVNEKYFQSSPPLTTGDISKILKQLGVPVTTANVSNSISRKAKSYVMFDGVRTKGAVVRYSLNRRGIQYFEGIIGG